MKNYKDILSDTLSEIKEEELKSIPDENEINHEFSDKFNRKSKKLIKEQKKYESSSVTKTISKIAAVIIATIIAVTLISKADASPDKILDFLYYVYENYIIVSRDAAEVYDTSEFIVYTLKEIPEGFKEKSYSEIHSKTRINWDNDKTQTNIKLSQTSKNTSGSLTINGDSKKLEEFKLGSINVIYITYGDYISCFWTEHNSDFELTYPKYLGKDFAVSNIGNLVVRETP